MNILRARLHTTSRKEPRTMFERYFDRFNTRNDRGSRRAVNTCACTETANDICLCCLDTALAVSIFAALRLIVIRLASLIIAGVVVPADRVRRPDLVSAN